MWSNKRKKKKNKIGKTNNRIGQTAYKVVEGKKKKGKENGNQQRKKRGKFADPFASFPPQLTKPVCSILVIVMAAAKRIAKEMKVRTNKGRGEHKKTKE